MVTRAEQDKMMDMVADIQGKATRLTSEVEEHDEVIKQIKAIKWKRHSNSVFLFYLCI